jgi:hypothetical protein
VLFKFNARGAGQALPFSGRYFTRLLLLSGFCVVAMVALGMPALRERFAEQSAESGAGTVQTAIAPSPFGELGLGVIMADDRPRPVHEGATESPNPMDSSRDQLPAVNQEILRHVLDKTSDLSRRPFYHLLTLAATAQPALLDKHARRGVTYAEIWNEPEKFRGELIHLKGYLRGLEPWQATASEQFNPARLQTLYDGYLFTNDSHPNPYVIVLPRVADGMPTGRNITENVTFAGYFLKLWRYKSADGTERAAPLLMGQMITWTPAPQQDRFAHMSSYLAGAFLILVVSLAGAIWAINHRHLRPRPANTAVGVSTVLAELDQLEKLDLPDPATSPDQIRLPDGPGQQSQ